LTIPACQCPLTVADVANASLPSSINELANDPEAWVTR
jgi:hypothetical protein